MYVIQHSTPSKDPKPSPPPDATDGIYIKNRTDKIRDCNARIIADNAFPSERYKNATDKRYKHCAMHAQNMIHYIIKHMSENTHNEKCWTSFKRFSGWSYDEPRPRIKWANNVPQKTQVQLLIQSLGKVALPNIYTRASTPECSSENVTVAPNGNITIRRSPRPISLSALQVPKKRTHVVITQLGERDQGKVSTLDAWRTLATTDVQYNSELQLY
jgi:hypothetical protein